MRKAAALVLAVGLMASLAACTSSTSDSSSTTAASACTPAASGKVSDAVAVTGAVGKAPTVKLTTPVTATATQRTVVTKGDGKAVVTGDRVKVEFTMYNGTTGAEITNTGYATTPVTFELDEAKFIPGIVKTLNCSTIGSRVVGVIPPVDAFGTTGSETNNIAATDSIVFVADVISKADTLLTKATGDAQKPVAGLPTVKLSDAGVPTVTIPSGNPSTKLEKEVLIKGKGATVPENSNVVVNYQGTVWSTKTIFDDSWARGASATFNTGAVVAGFKQALEGQTVGSQILVTIPPSLGYGTEGNTTAGIKGTDTLVFVIDILGLS
ncbi:FKBP-type peptidyl-prolyl cis-trans isomerase [Glaciihabitans sp. dw_435]|uniref:FKBP-type peptidyl-prolyl cis-trans isomerase n=1 Tax=Glaciihabitans sp. dw_435 TaxID=2720081 RepID=UPI001BD2512C|nr:FKBP-type peptidyl-prolyl cis-trans isomerase [Glaciihabitans sp. dw_435]